MLGPDISEIKGYHFFKEIGHGSFGNVYLVRKKKTSTVLAAKVMSHTTISSKLLNSISNEIEIHKQLRHMYIVDLIDYIKTEKYFCLFMRYCELGDLQLFIRSRNDWTRYPPQHHEYLTYISNRWPCLGFDGLHPAIARHFTKQLAAALYFLRQNGIMHRDFKPQNLLLTYSSDSTEKCLKVGHPDMPVLKLADFGFARTFHQASLAETLCGSPLYMAPEILKYEKYDARADLWSIGTIIYEMITGIPPFRADNHIQLLKKIERTNDKIKFVSEASGDEDLKDLCMNLLKISTKNRISFDEFFQHPVILTLIDRHDESCNVFASSNIQTAFSDISLSESDNDRFVHICNTKIPIEKSDQDLTESDSKTSNLAENISVTFKSTINLCEKISHKRKSLHIQFQYNNNEDLVKKVEYCVILLNISNEHHENMSIVSKLALFLETLNKLRDLMNYCIRNNIEGLEAFIDYVKTEFNYVLKKAVTLKEEILHQDPNGEAVLTNEWDEGLADSILFQKALQICRNALVSEITSDDTEQSKEMLHISLCILGNNHTSNAGFNLRLINAINSRLNMLEVQ